MKDITLDLKKPYIDLKITEDCNVKALFLGKNNKGIKTNIRISFFKSNIKARIIIKSVLFDKSSLNLDCKLIVPRGIKNVDGYLDIKVLNLSDESGINIIPGLEIKDNDVKCGHALTIGKPDQNQIQYLKSRGISEEQAIDLIVQGFLEK